MSELTDRSVNASNLDLTNCDREPIQFPGSIQPHGALIAFDEGDDLVLQASDNIGDFLDMRVDAVLGGRLTEILGTQQAALIKHAFASGQNATVNPIKLHVGAKSQERLVNGILHREHGTIFLELEPAGDVPDAPIRAYQMTQKALSRIHKVTSMEELWVVVAEEVKSILGYDRVMIYRFDRAKNGEVIEERVNDGIEPFKGLCYPASDIPAQARLLYTVNCIRHIPDATYAVSPLIPLIFPMTGDLTDLSHCELRSVSPIHLEYLRNMGVAASTSISLLQDSALWGLIACHNYTPKFVPYEMRAACELLGQVVSLRMSALESEQKTNYKLHANILQSRFLGALAEKSDLQLALIESTPNIMEYVQCTGAAVCRGKEYLRMGKAPSEEQLGQLVRRMKRMASPVFVTDALSTVYSDTAAFKDVASGVLGLTLDREKNIYILWFRPEQIETVTWGGDPRKPVTQDANMRLSPRKSFEKWKETVGGKSVPWTDEEIESALDLRNTIASLLSRG